MFLIAEPIVSQNNRDYAIATSLMKRGEYEQAVDLLEVLYRQNPTSYPILNSYLDCLVELKRYDDAIQITENRLERVNNNVFLSARLGTLHLLNEDSTKAFQIWENALQINRDLPQAYREIGEAYAERGLYDKAVEVYQKSREIFNNPFLFTSELANIFLKMGDYESTANEWLSLVISDPGRTSLIQRRLYRYNDEELLNAIIVASEDLVRDRTQDQRIRLSLKEMLVWLYIDRGLYRKALASAKSLEIEQGLNSGLPLFQVAIRLRSAGEYELAEQALNEYLGRDESFVKQRAISELAELHAEWAKAISSNDSTTWKQIEGKYLTALKYIDQLKNYPNTEVSMISESLETEIVLDYLADTTRAFTLFENLTENKIQEAWTPEEWYIAGRIALVRGKFTEARFYLTRAKNLVKIGSLAEKSSFYLGYADFLSGDAEFAKIQFKALERQHSSLYANDALKVRTWIQYQPERDTINTDIQNFATAMLLKEQGKWVQAVEVLDRLSRSSQNQEIIAESILQSSKILERFSQLAVACYVSAKSENITNVSQKETLLWRIARYGELSMLKDLNTDIRQLESSGFSIQSALPEKTSPMLVIGGQTNIELSKFSFQQVIEHYEALLIEFPNGYFANLVRKRLRAMETQRSS